MYGTRLCHIWKHQLHPACDETRPHCSYPFIFPLFFFAVLLFCHGAGNCDSFNMAIYNRTRICILLFPNEIIYIILIIFLFTYVNNIAMRLSYSPCTDRVKDKICYRQNVIVPDIENIEFTGLSQCAKKRHSPP